jgi:molybdenum cofactor cytidylyltransferase
VREQILAGTGARRLPAVAGRQPAGGAPFATDNRRYRVDIDTPEDLERLAARTGHRLLWPSWTC